MKYQHDKGAYAFPMWGLFFMALLVILTLGKAFFLPVLLAIFLSLTFSPVVRALRRRGVPESVSAGLMVLFATVGFAFAISYLADPLSTWIERFPAQFLEIKQRLSVFFDKLTLLQDASNSLSMEPGEMPGEASTAENGDNGDNGETGIIAMAATNILSIATAALVTMVLSFFLLAKGRLFYSKILERFSGLQDKKDALSTVYTIERSISRYLLTITLINMLLGVAIGTAMWLLGMPSPLLWGIAAAVLNFLPYIGALMGIIGSAVVAVLTFDALGSALIVPLVYALLTGLEGQFVTPAYVGKSLSINPVVIFLSVAMWSVMWGLAGALIAVPLLVVINTIAQNVDSLSWFAHFISDYEERPEQNPEQSLQDQHRESGR